MTTKRERCHYLSKNLVSGAARIVESWDERLEYASPSLPPLKGTQMHCTLNPKAVLSVGLVAQACSANVWGAWGGRIIAEPRVG